jgi:integrase
MARTVRYSKFETRTGRDDILVSSSPYWKSIHICGHIGYYKGKKARKWYARYRNEGENAGYKKKTIGTADDFMDADGHTVLTFRDAQLKAQEWFREIELQRLGLMPTGKYTVEDAINEYARWYKMHRKSWKRLEPQINAHILPALGKIEVSKLTAQKIRNWHYTLAETPPRRRTSKLDTGQNYGVIQTEEDKRKRKSTANRILTTLKAALNKAYQDKRVSSDDEWRRVKPFEKVDLPRIDYLRMDEIPRFVNVCDVDFKPMVQAALYTGCRYGELCTMQVNHYDRDIGTIDIPESKSGKPRTIFLSAEGQAFFENHVLTRQNKFDLMFARADGSQWKKSHQTRRMKDACKRARIDRNISFHILRHTHASQLVMSGVPMAVVAKQLGNNVKMSEKHYAHLAPSYVGDTIRAHFPDLGINVPSNVEVFRGKQAGQV